MTVTLADVMGLPVHLVRVVDFDPVRGAVEAGVVTANAYVKAHAADISLADTYLAEQVQILRNKDVATTSELRTGAPASELLNAIHAGDLVVLTTRERGGIQRWSSGAWPRSWSAGRPDRSCSSELLPRNRVGRA